jgi:beta-N-acetylhexosaminidase
MNSRHASPRSARRISVGRLLVVGLEADRWSSSLERRLQAWNPSGVLFTAHNLSSPAHAAEMLARIVRTLQRVPLLALEQEGGAQDPLGKLFPPLASPAAAARAGAAFLRKWASTMARAMRHLGFNTNLAPLLDLAPASGAGPGPRAFGSGPEEVARCARTFVAAMRKQGILSCPKYFPGYGEARRELSPSVVVVVSKAMAALWREDLLPYRRLLPRLPLVLVSGAAYKAYDFNLTLPAARSAKVLEGLLRVKLGYRGIAVGEGNGTAGRAAGFPQAAAQAIETGCDLLLVREEASVVAFLASLARGLDSLRLSPRRFEKALARSARVLRGLAPPRGKVSAKEITALKSEMEKLNLACRQGGQQRV